MALAAERGAANGFGIDNLPFGVGRLPGGRASCLSALGHDVVDLAALARAGRLDVDGLGPGVLDAAALNPFLACGRPVWSAVRARLAELVEGDDEGLAAALVPAEQVVLLAPVAVGDFLDFNASLHHATTMGRMLRPDGPAVAPHWRRMPLGYTGRASSVVVSGTPVRRPCGQVPVDGSSELRPTAALDLEAEVGAVIGVGSRLGEAVTTGAAAEHVAGLVLVNDWSARDVQAHESQPLGPFLGKSFATSVSPWLVTLDALAPFRVPAPPQDPAPAAYLATEGDWAYDVRLEVALQTEAMRVAGRPPAPVSISSLAVLYWTVPQLVAHATVNGAPLRTGDLLGTGTVSGPAPASAGSLMELSWGGRRPLTLPDGSTRTFLEDGDTVVIQGWAGGDGRPLVSLGEVAGTVLPARTPEV
ncbi:MAG: fumarylacetoacetase [Acidimicrobiales bacterium]